MDHRSDGATRRVDHDVAAGHDALVASEVFVAPGGWRRAIIGLSVGIAAGMLYALVERRERLR